MKGSSSMGTSLKDGYGRVRLDEARKKLAEDEGLAIAERYAAMLRAEL